MSLDSRAPVLVGVGAVLQRETDPSKALEPVALMQAALERAAEDAGSRDLLARADSVRAARGFWDYPDPCRTLAEAFGAKARTVVSEIGVLQTTLLGSAAADVAAGRSDVVLITGGEARFRAQCARRAGVEAPLTHANTRPADEILRPEGLILTLPEVTRGLGPPVRQYAVMETALRAAESQSVEDHAQDVAELWAGMSRVAAENPHAWNPEGLDSDAIRSADLLSHPYGKRHTSQWNVDQAAGLIVCSAGTARSLGIPESRFIHPWGVVDSNHMVPLTERRALHRCVGFEHAGMRLAENTGIDLSKPKYREIYSCFPSAVRIQLRELGLMDGKPITVTGGMAFAGGPLNHFVFQSMVRMAELLRADPGSHGLVTAVSGVLTKQGTSLWSSEPPPSPFRFDDVTAETEAALETVTVDAEAAPEGQISGYTVMDEGTGKLRTVAFCERSDGMRTLASSLDPELAEAGLTEDLVGRSLVSRGEDVFLN